MAPNLTQRIEDCLQSTGFHPDCAEGAEEKMNAAIAVWNQAKSAEAIETAKAKVYSLCNDLVLMQGPYFQARLKFLSKLIECLEDRPESKLDVADDGCGSGVDLHVLHTLLGEKLSLTGIDIDQIALALARDRVPSAVFVTDYSIPASFDVMYSDFMSTGKNTFPEVLARSRNIFDGLRSGGLVLQNTDTNNIFLHCKIFGMQFSKIFQPELLVEKDDNNCYLARYEKD